MRIYRLTKNLGVFLPLVFCVVLLVTGSLRAQAITGIVRVHGCWAGRHAAEGLAERFGKVQKTVKAKFTVCDNEHVSQRLADEKCDVAIHRDAWTPGDSRWLREAQAKRGGLQAYTMGKYAVYVLANARNPVKAMTIEQLGAIYRGSIKDWGEIPGGAKGKPIHIFSPVFTNTAYHLVHLKALQCYRFDKRLRDRSAKPLRMKLHSDAVISAVAKDPNAIGFFLFDHRDEIDKRVRVLGIVPRRRKTPVFPSEETIYEGKYPLCQKLTMYVHANGPLAAHEFCGFAMGESSAELLRKHYLFPEHDRLAYFGRIRLKAMKSGKGVHVSVVSVASGRTMLPTLATEYVRAKEVIRPSFASTSEPSSVERFVLGKSELLFLGDKPSVRAMDLHGEKWNALGRDKQGRPDGTGPAEYVIASRAVAIIVNPTNKIKSLTLGQIQAMFNGELRNWSVLGETGLTAPVGPGGRPGEIRIHPFGLFEREPATAVFGAECLARDKWSRVTSKKDTAAAVAAVGVDPQAIAFVDLTAIPAGDRNVKILAIQMGIGKKARIVEPTIENIRTAMYPLTQRLFLYVHPKASKTAKDFAAFVATCGGSEAGPYADTVKAVMTAYKKQGLIPLSDVAIKREAQDAAAAAAKAAADKKNKKK